MDDKLSQAITDIISHVPYGDVTFTVYRHGNETKNLVTNEFRNTLFSDNEQAVKWVLLLLKEIVDKSLTGTTSFTIAYHDGKIKKITEQTYGQHLLKEAK